MKLSWMLCLITACALSDLIATDAAQLSSDMVARFITSRMKRSPEDNGGSTGQIPTKTELEKQMEQMFKKCKKLEIPDLPDDHHGGDPIQRIFRNIFYVFGYCMLHVGLEGLYP